MVLGGIHKGHVERGVFALQLRGCHDAARAGANDEYVVMFAHEIRC
jgi:hypothetical protein